MRRGGGGGGGALLHCIPVGAPVTRTNRVIVTKSLHSVCEFPFPEYDRCSSLHIKIVHGSRMPPSHTLPHAATHRRDAGLCLKTRLSTHSVHQFWLTMRTAGGSHRVLPQGNDVAAGVGVGAHEENGQVAYQIASRFSAHKLDNGGEGREVAVVCARN